MKYVLLACVCFALPSTAFAQAAKEQKPPKRPATVGKNAWTIASALAALEREPGDPYLYFVVTQLARTGNAADKTEIKKLLSTRGFLMQRLNRQGVDALSLFSGAHAVQESLQLEGLLEGTGLEDLLKDEAAERKPDAVVVPTIPAISGPAETLSVTQPASEPKKIELKPAEPEPGDPKTPERKAGNVSKTPDVDAVVAPPPPFPGIQPDKAKEKKPRKPGEPIEGPQVKSHPWTKMLAGKTPAVSRLSTITPLDFYLVEFRSLNKLLDVLAEGQDWASYIFTQGDLDATTPRSVQRYQKQLFLETHPALRPFHDDVVGRVAVVGSDLFLREGSDMTVLLELKNPAAFRLHAQKTFSQAERDYPDAELPRALYKGVSIRGLVSRDGAVRVYAADPRPDLHFRSNSQAALLRVLDTIQGEVGPLAVGEAGAPALGTTDEFRYLRTLMPLDAAEEDGFVYLSDPFVRRLIGPEVKLIERRRMIGFSHLRMITYAAQLYLTQTGERPRSLKALETAGFVPGVFNEGKLKCPFGGTYTLASDGLTGLSTALGRTSFLRPGCELSLKDVTPTEEAAYEAFVENYNQYWRTYFDPIAVRLKMTPTKLRAETIVLPLIDNSIYSGLAEVLGGSTERLDKLPVPNKNLLSINVKWNKAEILKKIKEKKDEDAEAPAVDLSLGAEQRRILANIASCAGQGDSFGITGRANMTNKDVRQTVVPQTVRAAVQETITQPDGTKKVETREIVETRFQSENVPIIPPLFGEANYVDIIFNSPAFKTRLPDPLHVTAWIGLGAPLDILDHIHTPILSTYRYSETTMKPVIEAVNRFEGDKFRETVTEKRFFPIAEVFSFQSLQPIGFAAPVPPEAINAELNSPEILPPEILKRTEDLFVKGLGSQIGMHLYDQRIMFDINTERFLGELLGMASRGRGTEGGSMIAGAFAAGFAGASFFSPAYLSFTVEDAKAVDAFLDDVDGLIGKYNHHLRAESFGVGFGLDFHHLTTNGNHETRAFGLKLGPVRWRLYVSRIGEGLFIANQTEVIDDLHAAAKNKDADRGPEGHGMFRIRPKSWNAALPGFQLAWAESNREACCRNLQTLGQTARAHGPFVKGTPEEQGQALIDLTRKIHGIDCTCPDGGVYRLEPDGKAMRCSLHETLTAPRQREAPAENSPVARLMGRFRDLQASLTFLPEGLRAVVEIERGK